MFYWPLMVKMKKIELIFLFSLVKNLKKANPLFLDLAFQPRFHKPAAGLTPLPLFDPMISSPEFSLFPNKSFCHAMF